MNTQPALPQLKCKLDWKAYYKDFAEKHGGSPILYKGRQYFADGWSYSSTDYAGPEWPPPTDPKELASIQLAYWYTRWNRARNELMVLRQRYDNLKGLQTTKDVPLKQIVSTRETGADGKSKLVREAVDWSPEIFEHTINYLEEEVKLADSHIKALKNPIPDGGATPNGEAENGGELA